MSDTAPRYADARELAAEVLARTRANGPFVSDLFDGMAADSGLDARDRHLAFELACGVVRHRRTLDCVLSAYSDRRIEKIAPPLKLLLRLGAYQLLLLERVPDHAAVNSTVELGKAWARKRLKKHPTSIASFVNGLLRTLADESRRVDRAAGEDPRRVIELPGASGFVVVGRDVLADPKASPADHLADAFSLPSWLAARWIERFKPGRAVEVARAQNRRPGLSLRVNTLLTDAAKVRDLLEAEGVQTAPLAQGLTPMLRVTGGDALGSRALRDGLVQPQDALSARVVEQLGLKGGMTVLDRCAAPGTKTTQIAAMMGDRGTVLAVDVSKAGLDRVHANARRMGCHIVHTMLAADMPARLVDLAADIGRIDRVLIDAPCSNSGVLARRPEARWRLSAESIHRQVAIQRELLMDGLNWLAPGGKCVYSTCSIEPEEDEQVVQYAVGKRHGQARLLSERLTLPSLRDDHDGGYWAILERVR